MRKGMAYIMRLEVMLLMLCQYRKGLSDRTVRKTYTCENETRNLLRDIFMMCIFIMYCLLLLGNYYTVCSH